MPSKRSLPEAHNPLLEEEHTPQLEILIERRRLGQTDLHVKPGQVGLNNATKAENLGIFDYAHLRVPLPPNLRGSGIFAVGKNAPYPESYFLMRRSSDGYISATGMFKAAFPWASYEEEQTERKHHKTLPTAGHEEVAGNVWVSPDNALDLAAEYHMRPWVVALLDPSPIELGTKDKGALVKIASPPAFKLSEQDKMFPAPTLAASALRKRDLRSASPSKSNTPRKIATPRKRRTKAQKAADDEASRATQSQLGNGVGSSSVEPTPSVASESHADDVVRVEVDETVEKEDDVETTHTTVKIEMPAGHKDLTLPDSAEGVLETSHEIVAEARQLEKAKANGKRKADVLEDSDESSTIRPAKFAKTPKKMEEQLKTERVKARALIGIIGTVALASAVTYIF